MVLISLSVLVFGCRKGDEEGIYTQGSFKYAIGSVSTIRFGIKSENNVFDVNDVRLQLYLGLYICTSEVWMTMSTGQSYDDYKNIDNFYLVRNIPSEEAFTVEYIYAENLVSGIIYNHSEEIRIPEEFFVEDKGELKIGVISFNGGIGGRPYCCINGDCITLDYELTEDGQVKITSLSKD